MERILPGFDHLLFVLALVLMVRATRLLLWTITAFTVGHSLTLALAVLGFVHVPQAPIEAGIALTICALAIEITRRNAGKFILMQRTPCLVAALFGLLHGLGFAGALAEVGLPQDEIPLALLAFNGHPRGSRPALDAVARADHAAPAYAIGCMAAFWFVERVGNVLSGAS